MKNKYFVHVKVFELDSGINILSDKWKATPEQTINLLESKYVNKKRDVFSVAAEEYKELIKQYESRNKS